LSSDSDETASCFQKLANHIFQIFLGPSEIGITMTRWTKFAWCKAAFSGVWLLLVLTSAGCWGGREASVEGVVTLDGQPLDHGKVAFIPIPQGAGAHATVQEDGTFAANTGGTKGLDPGEYLLTVRALGESTKDPRGGPPTPGKLLTPKKYTSSKTSGLQVTIQPGSNDVKLELRSDPSEKKKRKR
jgi:hypothetical protein